MLLVPLVRAAAAATTMQCGCGMQDAAEAVTNEGHDRDMERRPNGHAMLRGDD